MPPLQQLRDPARYRPCDWDFRTDAAGRQYWTDLFRWHLDAVLVPLIREEAPDTNEEQLAALRADYLAVYADIDARPHDYNPLNVLVYTRHRRQILERHGFPDPFLGIKTRENETALALLPDILAELDAADETSRQDLLVRGVMAGNIFDLGSRTTVEMHQTGQTAFDTTRRTQARRPWFIDNVDAWWDRWRQRGPYHHAVYFVDNAGGDVVLGCLPLARWMVQQGTRVTLAANTGPALNDVTADELVPLLAHAAAGDPALRDAWSGDALRVAASGCRTPLIDLGDLAPPFVDATGDADLLILHGMGRAIESNYDVDLTCDLLQSAVLKDESVADRHRARLLDCVFRFTPYSR